MILWELERVESLTRKHVPATPPCKGLIPWCPKSQGELLLLGCTNFVSNVHITVFTLFKVFMTKCILITFFMSKRINKQASNHDIFAAHKLLKIILISMEWSWHQNGKTFKQTITAWSQHINHKNEWVWNDHGMFAAHKSWKWMRMTNMGWHKYKV